MKVAVRHVQSGSTCQGGYDRSYSCALSRASELQVMSETVGCRFGAFRSDSTSSRGWSTWASWSYHRHFKEGM